MKALILISELFRFLFLASKYRILIHRYKFLRQSNFARFLLVFVNFLFYPFFFLKKKNQFGADLSNFLTELGPVYIKFGQTLSTRHDLLGEEIANVLRDLQNKLEPFDTEFAIKTIEKSYDTKISNIFNVFDTNPVASASIAQVYKAELIDSTQVAVKILRPNIRKIYSQNISLLELLLQVYNYLFSTNKGDQYSDFINIFKETMNFELDLRNEAAAASQMRDNFINDDTVHIPKIYWNLATVEILVLEWIDGVSVYDEEKMLQLNINRLEIAEKIAVLFFNQAYRDGFFHADLHPGNILIKYNGQVALIDFGIVSILPNKDRLAIAEILYSFLRRDYAKVASLHLEVGYITKDVNLVLFAQSCRIIAEPLIGLGTKDISIGKLLFDLLAMSKKYGMLPQPQLVMLQKTMILVEGVGYKLHPEINMWQLARPWIEQWAADNISHKAKIFKMLKTCISNLLKNV